MNISVEPTPQTSDMLHPPPCYAPELANPFTGHLPLRDYYVVQISKGLSMLEEKLACPMEHASHERRFMTAQQGLSGSNFYDEHCSNVTRTINHLEGFFLDPNLMMQESIYSRPTTTVDTAGCVHYLSDLMWQPDDWTANATNLNPSPMLEADLKDPIDNAMTRAFSFVETQMLFEETRKRKKVLYRQKPDHIRVRKNIGTRNKAVSTRWRSEQLPSRGLCLPQLPDITKTQQLSSQPF